MHDQTLRLANHGLNVATEIAELLQLPAVSPRRAHRRLLRQRVIHNVKAVYQRYLSWYDGNPANLHPHPPVPQARATWSWPAGPTRYWPRPARRTTRATTAGWPSW
jgi:alkyl sulfatase BDS1-like metallo-beta-lactamase superfamily hydrolase